MKPLGRIGQVEIARVFDSHLLGETAQIFFPDFDREALTPYENWLCPTHYNSESGHIPLPIHSWLMRLGEKYVLIDTCLGNNKSRPEKPEMHLLNSQYLARMTALGVFPEQIDYVLCTHLHVDHVGWNTRLENGRWVPTFPNARYVFSKIEYDAATKDAMDAEADSFMRRVFEESIHPVVESGQTDLVEGCLTLLDDITLRPAFGHSPGHMRIEVSSEGHHGIFVGDIVHSPIQVPLWHWSSRYCWDQRLATEARRQLLEDCVTNNALLIPSHFEAPYVGRITESRGTFAINFRW